MRDAGRERQNASGAARRHKKQNALTEESIVSIFAPAL
jgi:hypothetical protein